ncbi:MAG: hypothetical protein DLM73_16305 [Chthoniobacterales bacterium]|nr:MAG: hypothetical protein DLM73_16305 [Chthoniobacterales bacterium]
MRRSLITNPQRIRHEFPECYACDAPAISVEHAPPECFFPDTKDDKGVSTYKKNLITVPSCDLHNGEKSKDDLYAWFHLAAAIEANHCAELVLPNLEKKMEKDRSRGGKFSALIQRQIMGVVPGGVIGALDPARMARVLASCARAIYFYETFLKLKRHLRVANLDHHFSDPSTAQRLDEQRASFEGEMAGCVFKGDNPEVFQYALCDKPDQGIVIFEFRFYGALRRWVFYHPNQEFQQFNSAD